MNPCTYRRQERLCKRAVQHGEEVCQCAVLIVPVQSMLDDILGLVEESDLGHVEVLEDAYKSSPGRTCRKVSRDEQLDGIGVTKVVVAEEIRSISSS